jgi:hypothetical protein
MRPSQPQPAAESQPGDAPGTGRTLRVVITAFVAFNLFAIISWCVPLDTPLVGVCRNIARPYLVWTGLFQKWDMFAPNPSKLNCYVGAQILFRDGHSTLWNFPRIENLGIVDKYFKERYRKYANDNLRLDVNQPVWPDAARYIARLHDSPANPPEFVNLVRYWSFVPPPTPNGSYQPLPWNQYTFFRYRVAPGDLP